MAGFGTAPTQDTVLAAQIQQKLVLQSQMKGGASWFYWIAGLSIINSVIALSGSDWHFIAGLGITEIVDYIAKGAGNGGRSWPSCSTRLRRGCSSCSAFFPTSARAWAFIIGMTFYGLDALI